MKKKFLLALIMLGAIMMVGCVDADVTVDLEKNGTGKAVIDVLGPQAVFDNITEDSVNEWGKEFETVEKIGDSDKSGYRFTTRQGNLEEIFMEITNLNESLEENGVQNSDIQDQNLQQNSSDDVVSNTPVITEKVSASTSDTSNNLANELYEKYVDINEEKSLFSSTYDVNLKLKDAIYGEMSFEQRTLMKLLGQTANIGLHIKSPIEAKNSNATSVTEENGKHVYNWEYTLSDVQNISFSAEIPNVRNIAIIGIGAVVIVLGLVFVFVRKKKRA